jgi:hypothetical protein
VAAVAVKFAGAGSHATVRFAVDETEPMVAVMVAVPCPELVASPLEPGLLLMIATSALDVLQFTFVVMSLVLWSVYVPIAVNCCDCPRTMLVAVGVIAIETKAAGVTVRFAVPDTEPKPAVMLAVPVAVDVARPIVAGAELMVATVASDDVHWAWLVKSCVVPSLYVPVALNCCVVPSGIEDVPGVRAMDVRTAGET